MVEITQTKRQDSTQNYAGSTTEATPEKSHDNEHTSMCDCGSRTSDGVCVSVGEACGNTVGQRLVDGIKERCAALVQGHLTNTSGQDCGTCKQPKPWFQLGGQSENGRTTVILQHLTPSG